MIAVVCGLFDDHLWRMNQEQSRNFSFILPLTGKSRLMCRYLCLKAGSNLYLELFAQQRAAVYDKHLRLEDEEEEGGGRSGLLWRQQSLVTHRGVCRHFVHRQRREERRVENINELNFIVFVDRFLGKNPAVSVYWVMHSRREAKMSRW